MPKKLQVITAERGKNIFLQWNAAGYIKHTPSQTLYKRVLGENKQDSIFLKFIFFSFTVFTKREREETKSVDLGGVERGRKDAK